MFSTIVTMFYGRSPLVGEYGSTGGGRQFCSWSTEQGKIIFPCPRSRLRIWSRETGSAATSRPAPAASLFSTLRLNLVLTHRISPNFRDSVHLFIPPSAIGSVPSLSGHPIAYRWRSLPRVHRHGASSSQGSSSNGYCLFRFHDGPINVRFSVPTLTNGIKYVWSSHIAGY